MQRKGRMRKKTNTSNYPVLIGPPEVIRVIKGVFICSVDVHEVELRQPSVLNLTFIRCLLANGGKASSAPIDKMSN